MLASNETIRCPACDAENPITRTNCQNCGALLRQEKEELTPLKLGDIGSASESASGKEADLSALPPVPETKLEENPENKGEQLAESAIWRASNTNTTVEQAVGEYAEALLLERLGEKKLLRETARKKLIATGILGLAAFITLSLMMLYHRNHFLFIVILAALGAAYLFYNVDNAAMLAKRLISMPQGDMESILMSDSDQMVSEKKVNSLRLGMLGILLVIFVALFWSPRMILEGGNGEASIRFYSASITADRDVVLPDTWRGMPVTEIRGNVFENLSRIETVVLPNQLVTIRAHAFRNCSHLYSVVFPDTIRSIGSSAFRNCPRLGTVSLPSGCDVNSRAFKDSNTRINWR